MTEADSQSPIDALGDHPAVDVDATWLLVCAALVFFMQSGFAILSVGAVRAKNAKNILLQILMDACFGMAAFWLVGFAVAHGGTFGPDGHGGSFIGFGGFALNGVTQQDFYQFVFQIAIAALIPMIPTGGLAERSRMEATILYAIFIDAWVYPMVAHWMWSDHGWASPLLEPGKRLLGTGLIDFTGDSCVHMVGGLAALIGAYMIGPRIGRFAEDGTPEEIPGHNATLAVLGVFILWFGWYGFNPGSTLGIIGKAHISALVAVNTTIAAIVATITTMFLIMALRYYETNEIVWDLLGSANGTLAGLVAVGAGCSAMEPWAAVLVGATAAMVYLYAAWLVPNKLMIDDPLEAGAVHFFCGAWGLVCAGLFAQQKNLGNAYDVELAEKGYGLFMGGGGRLLGCAFIMIIVTILWTAANMFPFYYGLRYLNLLRVTEEEEQAGLDVVHHDGGAYDMVAYVPPPGSDKGTADESIAGGKSASRRNNLMQRMLHIEDQNQELMREVAILKGSQPFVNPTFAQPTTPKAASAAAYGAHSYDESKGNKERHAIVAFDLTGPSLPGPPPFHDKPHHDKSHSREKNYLAMREKEREQKREAEKQREQEKEREREREEKMRMEVELRVQRELEARVAREEEARKQKEREAQREEERARAREIEAERERKRKESEQRMLKDAEERITREVHDRAYRETQASMAAQAKAQQEMTKRIEAQNRSLESQVRALSGLLTTWQNQAQAPTPAVPRHSSSNKGGGHTAAGLTAGSSVSGGHTGGSLYAPTNDREHTVRSPRSSNTAASMYAPVSEREKQPSGSPGPRSPRGGRTSNEHRSDRMERIEQHSSAQLLLPEIQPRSEESGK